MVFSFHPKKLLIHLLPSLLLLFGGGNFVNAGGAPNAPMPYIEYGGAVHHIAAGANNNVWVTGQNNEVYRVDGVNSFTQLPGSGGRIAANGNNELYMVGKNGWLYYDSSGIGTNWVNVNGVFNVVDVGVNLDSNHLTKFCFTEVGNGGAGGGPIKCMHNGNIELIPGEKVIVDVQNNGMPVGINKLGHLYRAYGEMPNNIHWEYLGTDYKDVAVGPNGIIWGLKTDNTIIYNVGGPSSEPGGEYRFPGYLKEISIDTNNKLWAIGTNLRVYEQKTQTRSRQYRYEKNTIHTGFTWVANGYKWCVESVDPQYNFYGTTPDSFNKDSWGFEVKKLVNEGREENLSCMDRGNIQSPDRGGNWNCWYDSTHGNLHLYKC